MSKKTVLIWGATGQIASYLVEMYLEKDYKVYGIKRRSSTNTLWRVQHLLNNPDLELIEGDITDPSSVNNLTNILKPDLCINTAAQSHVGTSFEQPAYTFNVNANGVLYILESIKNCSPQTKFLQFSTSEMMGDNYSIDENGEKYQDESTQFSPVSQYAVSKLAAYHLVKLYRKAYYIFSCNNINFNSESPRRGEEFVTRKITQWIAKFKKCKDQDVTALTTVSADNIIFTNGYNEDRIFPKLRLGNITAYRDWSHAKDVCQGVYLALNYSKPDDYVFGSGKTQTVADFCKEAFKYIGIDNWEDYIVIDPKFYRPAEVDYLKSRPTKAKEVLGWETTISFQDLVKEMIEADIARENGKTA
jgi:GDPmannose 4,6-dehydratase